jgi:hypothetical protein
VRNSRCNGPLCSRDASATVSISASTNSPMQPLTGALRRVTQHKKTPPSQLA